MTPCRFALLAGLALLAAAPDAVQTGGPPTTIVTPGATRRKMGDVGPGAGEARPAATGQAPAQGGSAPTGSPGTAQRPTPDQSR